MPPGHALLHPLAHLELGVAGAAEGLHAADVVRHALGDDGVPPGQGVEQHAVEAVLLKAVELVAGLVIGKEHGRTRADLLEVVQRAVRRDRVGVDHARPEAVRAAKLPGDGIEPLPVLQPAAKAPLDPDLIGLVAPVRRLRQIQAGIPAELFAAGIAVADLLGGRALPGVVRDSIGMVGGQDLLQKLGDVFGVVAGVYAGEEAPVRFIRSAAAVPGEPVRPRVGEFLRGAVDVHARHDPQAHLPGGIGEFPQEVPVAKVARAVLQRKAAGIIGDDAARIDDDALNVVFEPVPLPEIDVAAGGVDLGQVGLAPAVRRFIPFLFCHVFFPLCFLLGCPHPRRGGLFSG